MDYTCLLCNQLEAVTESCPNCGEIMENLGLLQDFYDPYSPYLDQEIYQDNYLQNDDDHCVHLLACGKCGYEKFSAYRRQWEKTTIV
ncbi:hypothetical protein [Desulfofalx alkaliphila]|uniref:hypothetical protein n=1 Tax=Desulfofalx alkaliphila TaxID=105483 RepID=UPI0004E0D77C|nr:hypothetical protein [Desulfofalx alkaliphila]